MFRLTRIVHFVTKCFQNSQNEIVHHSMITAAGYIINRNTGFTKMGICSCSNNTPSIQFLRHYAKGKDKKKEKGKTKVHVDEAQLGEVLDVESMKTEMIRNIEVLKIEYTKNLSLRSAAGSMESLPVYLDGKDYTLQELSQIVRKNPKVIVVNMAAFPQAIPAALKAMQKSGMNLNPQQDGTTLYVPVPKVTREYREQLAKSAKQFFVKCRDNIKDVQNKHIKALKKKPNISEDLIYNVEVQIISLADGYIGEAQRILDNKQTELVGSD